jgi:hypothetical protein
MCAAMSEANPDSAPLRPGATVARPRETAVASPPPTVPLTSAGEAALAAARDLARNASPPAPPRVYTADWTHSPSGVRRRALSRRLSAPRENPAPRRSVGGYPLCEKCTAATTCRGIPRREPASRSGSGSVTPNAVSGQYREEGLNRI